MSSPHFFFSHTSQARCWRRPGFGSPKRHKPKKISQKAALSSYRTRKWVVQQGGDVFEKTHLTTVKHDGREHIPCSAGRDWVESLDFQFPLGIALDSQGGLSRDWGWGETWPPRFLPQAALLPYQFTERRVDFREEGTGERLSLPFYGHKTDEN